MQTKLTHYLTSYVNNYISPRLIFVLDFVLCVISSLLTIIILSFLSSEYNDFTHTQFSTIWLIASAISTIIVAFISRCYRVAIRHTTPLSNIHLTITIFAKSTLTSAATFIFILDSDNILNYITVGVFDFFVTAAFLLGMRMIMYAAYTFYRNKIKSAADTTNILIYGTNDKSVALIQRLANSQHYSVRGYITEDTKFTTNNIAELPVYQYDNLDKLHLIFEDNRIGGILFAHDADIKAVQDTLLKYCNEHKLDTLIAPSIDDIANASNNQNRIRQVKIEDLLGREEIKINLDEIKAYFKDKCVMVTGAAGSIGSELCRQLASFGISKLVLFDDAETPTHNVRLELEEKYPNLKFFPTIGDVRHKKRLDGIFRRHHPQVVFHAAAYKHVPLMEENPCEAVMVNVYGSRNVADKCIEYGVEMMVMISTDKAVNPTNIMGCSKRLAEIYVQSLGTAIANGEVQGTTKFVTTRFGNVLGSNGSVIPRFREQIEKGGPVTVTHPDITRFFMTIPEACRLVMEAATMSNGNEIFVFDMGESVRIADLARRMISLAGLELGKDIDIKFTGLRPGEKLYEEVLSKQEDTLPTSHSRIRIAKVREYPYKEISDTVAKLHTLADLVEIESLVRLMKATVPEFISKNSPFEKYDK